MENSFKETVRSDMNDLQDEKWTQQVDFCKAFRAENTNDLTEEDVMNLAIRELNISSDDARILASELLKS